jgi:hypothetical protein
MPPLLIFLKKSIIALHRLHQDGVWDWEQKVIPPEHPSGLLQEQIHTKLLLRMAELIKEKVDCTSCVYQMLSEHDSSRLGVADYSKIEKCLGRDLKKPENGRSGDFTFHHRIDLFVVANESRTIDPYEFQQSAKRSIDVINAALARLAQPIPWLSLTQTLRFKQYRPKGPQNPFELHYELFFSGIILDPGLSEAKADELRRSMIRAGHGDLKVPTYTGGWLNLRDL